MATFPRYEYEGNSQSHKLDLTNIPKECVTVTVSIKDEKLKDAIQGRISALKGSKARAIDFEQWGAVHRIEIKLNVLESVLKEANV
ncbi:hypothetical protein ACFYO2_26815 [Streptomyces sp. NPDC006602]|uniref:hypothetical protein n=1 Tax=Streptomyces sp. NPDC006602 TaxID=3364751 RepID=UPI0036902475